jgi:hypothetical protein
MWSSCKNKLIADGLPQAIAERISRPLREKLTNFGAPMIPTYKYLSYCWVLKWNFSITEIKLEALDVSEQPRKRQKTSNKRNASHHQAALREISPEYYIEGALITTRAKLIRGPRFVTRKDFPVGPTHRRTNLEIDKGVLVWTGRGCWRNRTYLYEAMRLKSGELMLFRQRELSLSKNSWNVKRLPKTKVPKQSKMMTLCKIMRV